MYYPTGLRSCMSSFYCSHQTVCLLNRCCAYGEETGTSTTPSRISAETGTSATPSLNSSKICWACLKKNSFLYKWVLLFLLRVCCLCCVHVQLYVHVHVSIRHVSVQTRPEHVYISQSYCLLYKKQPSTDAHDTYKSGQV